MKRLLFCAVLAGSLILLQPSPALVIPSKAPDKGPITWQKVEDFKVLKLWETDAGPKTPQIALLQLSEARHKELESNPLHFYEKYGIFAPQKSDRDQGHAVFNLIEYKPKGKDPLITVVCHGPDTYSAFASFAVADIN